MKQINAERDADIFSELMAKQPLLQEVPSMAYKKEDQIDYPLPWWFYASLRFWQDFVMTMSKIGSFEKDFAAPIIMADQPNTNEVKMNMPTR